ncbi:MAG: ABC transporter substrate-binding protein [Acidobacteriota bacterium]|nr:ABC transporter substrate-binding protein [Acidobacteriota bacterium]MDE3191147.1 ABC transporter substrate-binding protein [Acidobacteriota bacterium]
MRKWVVGALVAAAVAAMASTASAKPALTKVTLQLKWVPQAQFAGYYAAQDLGYYKAAGLDVTLLNGGPNITPEVVVASGHAQIGVDWLPSLLAARDKGTQLVNIAQVFARSGMTQLTWKSSGITKISQMRGKKVANWLGGNQWELFAALTKAGINPNNPKDVTIVQQPFDMNLFLKHQVDSASAMTYNELAQVYESGVKPSQINVIKMQDAGTGMLEDGMFSTASWLKSPANQATAAKVIGASLAGWIYCRDHVAACVGFTLKAGPTLGKAHQTWMMNQINELIWPNTSGIGIMNAADFNRTAAIAKQFGVIKKAPSAGAYRTDLAKEAVAGLKKQGMDVYGKGYKPLTVKIVPGGK